MADVEEQTPARYSGKRWRHWAVDTVVLALILIVAYGSVLYLCDHGLSTRGVWRRSCTPAVMLALGHGYVNCNTESAPALRDFIAQRIRSLDPADLPETLPTTELEYYHWRWGGLLRLVGWYWRFAGISWDTLSHLFAATAAATAVVVWLIFRVTLGQWPALAGAVLWLSSAVQLHEVSNFRDYLKAFFLLTGLLILAVAVRRIRRPWVLIGLALVLGAFLSVGLRFRDDVAVLLPLGFLMFGVCVAGPVRTSWGRRLLACLALAAAFLGTGWSYLAGVQEQGSHSPHNISMGLTRQFEERLGLGGVSYDLGPVWNDALTFSTINSYGQRMLGLESIYYEPSHAYDAMGRSYLREVIQTFPADRLLFAYASVVRSLNELPFSQDGMYLDHPTKMTPQIQRLHQFRWRTLGWLYGWGTTIALIAVLALAAADLRLGFAAACVLLYVGGYPSLQYDVRHAFFTEILLWWSLLLLLLLACRTWRGYRQGTLPPVRTMALRAAALAVFLTVGLGIPLLAARAYQQAAVDALYQSLREAPWAPVDTGAEPVRLPDRYAGSVLFPVSSLGVGSSSSPPGTRYQAYSDYLAVELQGQGETVAIRLEYERNPNFADFSRDYVLQAGSPFTSGSTFLYFPVYTVSERGKPRSDFRGIVLRSEDQHLLRGIYRLKDEAALPLWPTVALTPDSTNASRYLRWGERPRPWVQSQLRRDEENLIPHGGFEQWYSETQPAGMQAPDTRYSRLEQVPSSAGLGEQACAQYWIQPDGACAVQALFGVRLDDLAPNTEYELLLTADNRTGAPVRIFAAQAGQAADGAQIVERLGFGITELTARTGLRDHGGYFRTTDSEGLHVYIVATYNGKNPRGPVIWERWALRPRY
jgi:hypothetical protein